MFVDRVKIELHAGKGGDGCTSMRREKYVPRGGPDGGDGGVGASIILEARLGVNSLAAFANRHFYRAPKGQPGQGSMRHGRRGRDQTLYVPPGTTVIDAGQGFVIKDLKRPGESFVVARGGKGGKGNAAFKSSTNRTPREHTVGEPGEVREVILELKSIADVGLVGRPNAGKSTLLSRITSARPEIADYPFTTKTPNLGIVDVGAERSFVLADIPGLIEGASEGVGLGHEFLRHIERAGLLIHLVEPTPIDETDPIENYESIRAELAEYDQSLGKRDEIIVITKSELDGAAAVQEALQERTGRDVFLISAITGDGVETLLQEIMSRVDARREAMLAAGEDVTPLRQQDVQQPKRKRRVPPHLAGPTATLSNEVQAKDYSDSSDDGGRPRDDDVNASITMVAVDVGNTAVKLCSVASTPDGATTESFRSFDLRDANWAAASIDGSLQPPPGMSVRWIIASVQRQASDRLRQEILNRNPEASVHVVSHHDIPLATDVDQPEGVGVDRLLGALTAGRRFGNPVIVVDAGSAVTVDWVSAGGVFGGGVILPGLRLQAESLAAGTDALPQVGWQECGRLQLPAIPAKNTHDAILSGIVIGTAAAIDAIVDRYQRLHKEAVTVVLGGGDAATLSDHLQRKHVVVPNLVCRGLLELPISKGTMPQRPTNCLHDPSEIRH